MITKLRIAAFQRQPRFNDMAETLKHMLTDLKWCDNQDVCLAVFPECYLQGYASDKPTITHRALRLDSEEFTEVASLTIRFAMRC